MNVLIIEDEDYKYKTIASYILKLNHEANIIREKSRNSGIINILISIKKNITYDLIIIDNYLPLFDGELDLEPFAEEIVEFIRKNYSKTIPLYVCTQNEYIPIEDELYIKYEPNKDLTNAFKITKER